MKINDKINLLTKRAELIYKKLLIFLAISGGSWVYGLKSEQPPFLNVLIFLVFILSLIGIIVNLLKFGSIQKILKELSDDNN